MKSVKHNIQKDKDKWLIENTSSYSQKTKPLLTSKTQLELKDETLLQTNCGSLDKDKSSDTFCLSDKIIWSVHSNGNFIHEDDIREFIKELKNSFKTTGIWTREGALQYIDKLVGDRLI